MVLKIGACLTLVLYATIRQKFKGRSSYLLETHPLQIVTHEWNVQVTVHAAFNCFPVIWRRFGTELPSPATFVT